MAEWNVDVAGMSTLLGSLDTEVGDLRTAISDASEAVSACSGALHGPVATAFAGFVSPRQKAPQELVTMADAAAGGAVESAAALAVGNEEMADRLLQGRSRTAWSMLYEPDVTW